MPEGLRWLVARQHKRCHTTWRRFRSREIKFSRAAEPTPSTPACGRSMPFREHCAWGRDLHLLASSVQSGHGCFTVSDVDRLPLPAGQFHFIGGRLAPRSHGPGVLLCAAHFLSPHGRSVQPGGDHRFPDRLGSHHSIGVQIAIRAQELEAQIVERKRAEEALLGTRTELERVTRVTSLGQLTASIAHEINQPLAAVVINANACVRWLARDAPDLEEARAAARRSVESATRASETINRVRQLFKKGAPQRELVDVNEAIQEIIALVRGELARHSISVRTELAADLPRIMGDRVQLQQLIMNLMINGIDAMKGVDGARELFVRSQRGEADPLLVSVGDTGVGLPPQRDRVFDAFFTTKVQGTGMGLSISRSIAESHGGRLWSSDNSPRGAIFSLTIPTKM